jgi:adenosylmethionine---8-amino-7-oxononanoate aminotransferase
VQGAGGMRIFGADVLRSLRVLTAERGVPLIADEVMTGFGRTGALFACRSAGVEPDLLCLAKGLTGGLMPLAVTVAADRLFRAFWHEDRARAFFHGHSFTAHPIACAVALESLSLVEERDVPARLDSIGARIADRLTSLARHPRVHDLRRIGGIVAYDLVQTDGERGYLARIGPRLRARAAELGVLLRPLGNVVYAMPPACTSDTEIDAIAAAMAALADVT